MQAPSSSIPCFFINNNPGRYLKESNKQERDEDGGQREDADQGGAREREREIEELQEDKDTTFESVLFVE